MSFRTGVLIVLALCLCLMPPGRSSVAGSARVSPPAVNTGRSDCYDDYEEIFSSYTIRNEDAFKTAAAFSRKLEEEGNDSDVILAIFAASSDTKVDFELLLLKAIVESNLGQNVVSGTSSARGVFQFIEQTWLALMYRYGSEAGYPQYAAKILADSKTGIFRIQGGDRELRKKILDLRNTAYLSAYLKARQIMQETDVIRSFKKAGVNETDHYLAHLFGLRLAQEFYRMLNSGSEVPVAESEDPSLREAAGLNRWFFFKNGRALTAKEVYSRAESRIQKEMRNIRAIKEAHTPRLCIRSRLLTLASTE